MCCIQKHTCFNTTIQKVQVVDLTGLARVLVELMEQ